MKHNYKSTLILCMIYLASSILPGNKSFAGIGDTTIVQTIRYDSTMRAGVFMFPSNPNKTYEKIIMLYGMRCKDGQMSTLANSNLGCGEWDYNCYTYIVDSTQTDSLRQYQNDHAISNFSGTMFQYTNTPVWSYIRSNQQDVTYTNIISEDSAIIGTGNTTLSHPFNTGNQLSRIQYLWKASELVSAGFTAGNITGLRMDIASLGLVLNNLRIKIRQTTLIALDADSPVTTGFTEVYFLNTTFNATGMHSFNFNSPFNWDGTSNIIIEFSFTNTATGNSNDVIGDDTGFNAGLLSTQPDSYLNGGGAISSINVNPSFFPGISNEITIAFWAYGDSLVLPANTTIVDGRDDNNIRQVNIHLPYSDSNIYWDCGGDANGYDRINRLALSAEMKGRWNFWAFTKNAVTGAMTIYLNGVSWATGNSKFRPINIKNMIIGMALAGNNMYRGYYDEISFWNKALSATSIQQLMFHDISNTHPDYAYLLAYYKLNEGTGNIAYDATANGYNSTITNPGWRNHTGNSLFRNFIATTYRPNTIFVKGTYTTTVQNYPVLDSTQVTATSSISYQVINNTLAPIDTLFVWPSGYTYIYNTSGTKIDSILIPPQDTIHVVQVPYYQKRPMRLELINFITPYGKYFTALNGLNGRAFEFDVTDYAPVLKGPLFLAMDDGKYQEDNDIKFVFYEGTPPRNVKAISQIWPNATWVTASYNEIYTNRYFEPRNTVLIPGATQFKIRSAISGHGQEGEFISRNHTIKLTSPAIKNFTRAVWKVCGDNPLYPQPVTYSSNGQENGTWIYDRAGWCPGAAVDMKEYEITPFVTPGSTITLDYSLPLATNQGTSNYRVNNQLVSYGSPNFTLDAAVNYIKTPSKRPEFLRINPVCSAPVISIKNTGADTLKSLEITYGRLGGTMKVYNWNGLLPFLSAAEVTLPPPDWISSTSDQFIVYINKPNGTAGPDQYQGNDTMLSSFNYPAVYPTALVFDLLTNTKGSETSYTLTNSQGTVILNKNNLGNSTTYRDTVYLATDCYTLTLNDLGHDGLFFHFNPSVGMGHFYIRDKSNNVILKNFNPDFGNYFNHQFTVNFSLPVAEPIVESVESFAVYPNPAGNSFSAGFSLPLGSTAKLKLLNLLGEEILTESIKVSNPIEKIDLDISNIENGVYFVLLKAGNLRKMQKLVIAR